MKRPRVVWFNIDALRADIFYELLDRNKLPNLGMIFARSRRAVQAVSVFPTVTMTCQASLATGAMPGRHLLVGNGWYDRYGKRPSHRDYTDPESALAVFGYKMFGLPTGLLPRGGVEALGNYDLSGGTPTLYETLKTRNVRTAVTFNHISRGANEWVAPDRANVLQFMLCRRRRLSYAAFERSVARNTIKFIRDVDRLHRVLHLYFPGADGHSHDNGPDAQREFMTDVIDPLAGRILEALTRHLPLKEFYFALTSDHGQSQVKPDPAHLVHIKTVTEILISFGFNVYNKKNSNNPKASSVVVFPAGGACFLHIRNRETRHWYDPPRFRADLVETAAAITDVSSRKFGDLEPGWIDFVLIKDYENERYVVLDGHKVFAPDGYFSSPERKEKYPDAARRIQGLYSKRSPDLVLLANSECGFTFGKRAERGQHGGLCRDDSLVPLIFAGPEITTDIIPGIAGIIDVAPTIAALFDVPMPSADGRILPLF